jgi:hypothetical protein
MMVSMSEQMSTLSLSILPAMLSGPTIFLGVDVVDEFQYAFLEIEMFFSLLDVYYDLYLEFLCSLLMKRLIGIAYLRYWLFLLDLHVRLLHF